MTVSASRGRYLLLILIGYLLAAHAVETVRSIQGGQGDAVVLTLTTLGVVFLSLALFGGSRLVQWVLSLVLATRALTFLDLPLDPWDLLFGLGYLAAGFALACAPDVNAYFSDLRSRARSRVCSGGRTRG